MKLSNLLQIVSLIVLVAGSAVPAVGQFHEDFESTLPTWQRKGTDCIISDSNWDQRRTNDISSRNRFEKIHFKNGPGTQIFVSHDVSPAFIIPELIPSVRIKATRPGIGILVRVVLPHTPSPTGEGPMTTMIPGPRYRATGKWETLSFADNKTDLQQQLQEEIWLLRRKFGAHVDQRDAYVDKIVLNLYSNAGESTVQIDDLKLSGIVSADAVADRAASAESAIDDPAVVAVGFTQQSETRKSLVVRDGTVLLVKKKPFFPIVIEHNGEPLDYLQALGFNTIELKSVATKQQLRQAQELNLWLICPAPASVGLVPIDFQYDRVLAWTIGEKLTSRDIPIVQQRVREIRESDKREGRPIVAHVDSDWSRLSQLVDVLATGVEPIGTSFIASQYSDWISQRSQAIGNGKPIWADVQTQLSKSLVQQIGTLANKTPPIPVEPQQVKFLVYESIAGGARGLRFLSRTRLDGNDPVTRLRAQTLEWVNAEVAQLEPWAVGGAVMGKVATGNDQLEVTAINTNRSRLLLIQRPTHHEQYLAGDVPIQTVAFQDSDSSATDRAYLIDDTALVPLANSKSHAGTQVEIENCPFSAAVVLTQDPLVVNKLSQSYERVGRQSIMQMHTELTQQWLAIMQLIDKQMGRMGRSSSIASGALNDAVNSFRTAQGLIDGSSPQSAVDHLHRTDERLSFMRREIITGPLGMFQSKTSTPFVVHCSLIPLHWELASRLTTSEWNPNGLPGGDFENLQHMMTHGWENRRLDDDFLETKVELSDSAAIDGKFGLKLTVVPKQNSVGLIESAPLWIATPEIPVKGGQLVRIHGWANVPQVIRGSHDGLKITDTLGGAEMAERIPVTQGWQEFTLYRGVASTGTVQVTFSLNGIGEASLDEVTIRTIELPPPGTRQARK